MSLKIESLLQRGIDKRVYPGAVILVAVSGVVIKYCTAGYCQLIPYPVLMKNNSIFDLASMTKPLATTLSIMKLVSDGLIDLDTPISDILPVPRDKRRITLRMLLSHSSGLPAWKPYYLRLTEYPRIFRKDIIRKWILKEELVFSPGKDNLYSDLGFILLEWIIESIKGLEMRDFLTGLYNLLNLERTFLAHPEYKLKRQEFAATEFCLWRNRLIQGEVHDENAFSVGGYSGHAGLFSTANDIFVITKILLEHYYGKREDIFKKVIVEEFFRKQNKRWALGWDTPTRDNSSCGGLFSENSIGHLGFTGTSIWVDLQKDIVIIFLTNRICPTRKNEKIKQFRPLIHNTIMKELS